MSNKLPAILFATAATLSLSTSLAYAELIDNTKVSGPKTVVQAEAIGSEKAAAKAKQKAARELAAKQRQEQADKAAAEAKAKRGAEIKAFNDAKEKAKREKEAAKLKQQQDRELAAKQRQEQADKAAAEAKAKREAEIKAFYDAKEKAKREKEAAKLKKKQERELAEKQRQEQADKAAAEAKAKREAAKLKQQQDRELAEKQSQAQVKKAEDVKQPATVKHVVAINQVTQSPSLSNVDAAKQAFIEFEKNQASEAAQLKILNNTNISKAVTSSVTGQGTASSETALQKATSNLITSPKSQKDAMRVALFGFHASPEQKDKLNEKYAYDTKLTLMPKNIGNIKLRMRLALVNGKIELYNTANDKKAAEEFFSYHPRHSQIFAAYVTRVLTMSSGQTGGVSLDKAFVSELTYDFANTKIKSAANMQKAQDQYLYIINRLGESDRIKFWNWINSVRDGDKIEIPNWVVLANILYS